MSRRERGGGGEQRQKMITSGSRVKELGQRERKNSSTAELLSCKFSRAVKIAAQWLKGLTTA